MASVSPDRDVEAGQQDLVHQHPVSRLHGGNGTGGFGDEFACQRPRGFDGLQFDQALVGAIRQTTHGAHGDRIGGGAETGDESAFGLGQTALFGLEGRITA